MNGKKAKRIRKEAYERSFVAGRQYDWECQENKKGKSITNIVNKGGTMRYFLQKLKKVR